MARTNGIHHVRITTNSDEHHLLRLAAASKGRSMTEFTRTAVLKTAVEEMKEFQLPTLSLGRRMKRQAR